MPKIYNYFNNTLPILSSTGMLFISGIIKHLSASIGEEQAWQNVSSPMSTTSQNVPLDHPPIEGGQTGSAAVRLLRFAATLETLRSSQSTLFSPPGLGPSVNILDLESTLVTYDRFFSPL